MRSLLVTSLLWCAGIAQAHDLITSESAERYLAQAQQRLEVLHSRQPPAQRAESAFALGRMLDEIRDLLNRDVAAHGRIQGLSTEYLVRELKRKGLTLELSPALGRFPANVSWYREALRIAPEGAHTNDAMFGILQGEFYDSFDADPLQARAQPWSGLQDQIALGEQLIKRAPAHPRRRGDKVHPRRALHARRARCARPQDRRAIRRSSARVDCGLPVALR